MKQAEPLKDKGKQVYVNNMSRCYSIMFEYKNIKSAVEWLIEDMQTLNKNLEKDKYIAGYNDGVKDSRKRVYKAFEDVSAKHNEHKSNV